MCYIIIYVTDVSFLLLTDVSLPSEKSLIYLPTNLSIKLSKTIYFFESANHTKNPAHSNLLLSKEDHLRAISQFFYPPTKSHSILYTSSPVDEGLWNFLNH